MTSVKYQRTISPCYRLQQTWLTNKTPCRPRCGTSSTRMASPCRKRPLSSIAARSIRLPQRGCSRLQGRTYSAKQSTTEAPALSTIRKHHFVQIYLLSNLRSVFHRNSISMLSGWRHMPQTAANMDNYFKRGCDTRMFEKLDSDEEFDLVSGSGEN